ncbi:hypothetical protein GGTG_00659 [Gaeumannomyces tritici R3-111a-1]|uniref:Uncharacterized protein n=1 Tax=Gaeumannomyces tritici (strain R3-111a-1) TaxID=644352 RepID=J3NHC2_GAET3|nr:hypothetical protein GGTG_00659 [Gaeumannomyces tritici R3-111a-1]EJT80665.1 hypothetical protein GGTG_00659 [Gaeumannomyces tritici R3-111a-1]
MSDGLESPFALVEVEERAALWEEVWSGVEEEKGRSRRNLLRGICFVARKRRDCAPVAAATLPVVVTGLLGRYMALNLLWQSLWTSEGIGGTGNAFQVPKEKP